MESFRKAILQETNHMAEIIAAKKSMPRVDLTPMVDLGFLLITFFMISTTMKEQRALRFFLPQDGTGTVVGESTTLTLVPTENNTVLYFHGSLGEAVRQNQLGSTGFSLQNGVGQLIRDKKALLRKSGKDKDLAILVYPDQSSTYKNVVDIIDELLINDVHTYCISDDAVTIAALKENIMVAEK